MRENTAASVREFVWQWQRHAQVTQPNEVERAIATWAQERQATPRRTYRESMARALVALATWIAPAAASPDPITPMLAQ